jgi:hypothetical protein
VTRFKNRDRFAAYNGTAPIEVSSGGRKAPPAEQAREPPDQPRHPHGRQHPDPAAPQRGPRLLRQEAGRGQDAPGSPARPETADQRRRLRPPPRRRTPSSRPVQGPGRAVGERLCNQRGRITPQKTGSSDKPLPGLATTLRPGLQPDQPKPLDTKRHSLCALSNALGLRQLADTEQAVL